MPKDQDSTRALLGDETITPWLKDAGGQWEPVALSNLDEWITQQGSLDTDPEGRPVASGTLLLLDSAPKTRVINVRFHRRIFLGNTKTTRSLPKAQEHTFYECHSTECTFIGWISRVGILRCNLVKCTWDRVIGNQLTLTDTLFDDAIFNRVDLIDTIFNTKTTFEGSIGISGMSIDRYSLEMLGPSHGGLSTAARMDMTIRDAAIELRQEYSGFWQWMHLSARGLFIAPYAAFVCAKVLESWWLSVLCRRPEPAPLALRDSMSASSLCLTTSDNNLVPSSM